MRDKARFVFPGLAALLALVGTLAVGPSSANRATSSGPSGRTAADAHRTPAQAGGAGIKSLITASPAPGLGISRSQEFAVPVALLASHKTGVAKMGTLRAPDVLVVGSTGLPRHALTSVLRLHGVTAAVSLDAARLRLNGKLVSMLGVNPSTFRDFAARPMAASNRLWQSVADGAIAASYSMGKLDKLPLGGKVTVTGRKQEKLRVGSLATVGISGVDAVVSDTVAHSLGFPHGNAILISAPHTNLATLVSKIRRVVPKSAGVDPLVSQADVSGTDGAAGIAGVSASSINGYPTLTSTQIVAMLKAAESRVGMPYVWGGAGPRDFDCSGLVLWSFAQAGLVMPRVADDQALTGPSVPLSRLEPGDLLFYHTDPSDPKYISHVAIYLGRGMMIQAPEPGMDVEVVPAALGSEFAGAVRVDPRIAAQVAGVTYG
ncbi:MAG TPA: C40 family peptidase [Streptosporangiaceae bacterium]|nr:C40 family peptidase [Streptosporangiaceae bacterium]